MKSLINMSIGPERIPATHDSAEAFFHLIRND
jgi:hypothetical protein